MPATGALRGTPASISDKVDPQTDAMDVDPLDESISDTTLIVYANSSGEGNTGIIARSASAPCHISRRDGNANRPDSPTENGGML